MCKNKKMSEKTVRQGNRDTFIGGRVVKLISDT